MALIIFSGSGSYRKDIYDCDKYEATQYLFDTRKLSARFARASTFLASAKSF